MLAFVNVNSDTYFFGWPDLYDIDNPQMGIIGVISAGIGNWCLNVGWFVGCLARQLSRHSTLSPFSLV
jgi:hypothetical protein